MNNIKNKTNLSNGDDVNDDVDVDNINNKTDLDDEIENKKLFFEPNNNSFSIETKFDADTNLENKDIYVYPVEQSYQYTKKLEPCGTQWIHDVQVDDEVDENYEKNKEIFNRLRAVKLPVQKSNEWHAMRKKVITASAAAGSMGEGKYGKAYDFILEKCDLSPFIQNKFCHHGVKYEEIATMIYARRMNVQIDEFGLMLHPTIPFLGASPDGICTPYKFDGIHKSKYVGRMLEIKCPVTRVIQTSGEVKDGICPYEYWVQVQLQLECCELEECDFWQCDIKEYASKEEFLNDTDPLEPFRSLSFGLEKGCVIQLFPKEEMSNVLKGKYLDVLYGKSKHIYPPKIEMTPHEIDIWLSNTLNDLNKQLPNYYFDKILYWKLEKSHNVTIARDRQWFAEILPVLEEVWNKVLFFRNNKDKITLLNDYINSKSRKMTKDITTVIKKIYDVSAPNYNTYIESLQNEIIVDTEVQDNKKMLDMCLFED